ncbi:MAG: hypothetical protein JNG90_02190 [Planctomycetaceae bacterium]|nr:hypothetical protein [Planctomycetaceae bacterium]
MSTKSLYTNWRFWSWTATAFTLGIAVGFALCIVVGIILTATTSYAQ